MNSVIKRPAIFSLILLLGCAVSVRAANYRPRARAAEPAAPVFSMPGGVFTNEFKLELTADSAVIRYTSDGSEPHVASPAYKEPLAIGKCALIRAKAWYSDGGVSPTASQSYFVLADDLREFHSNLPLVAINTCGAEITPGEKSLVGLHVAENKTDRTRLTSAVDFSGLVLLNLRGHSSLRYPKRSFSVKAVNELREPRKMSMLDMPKDPDWVLYAPFPDKTLLRDVLAYELSRQMGNWAPHTRFVEVFVNDSGGKLSMEHYAGVYVFQEKITRSKQRVNITELKPDDAREPQLTGGYIFKKDHSSSRERKRLGPEGPPPAGIAGDRTGFPTGPGGFPADPAGFLPAYGGSTRGTRPTKTPPVRVGGPVTNYLSALVSARIALDDAEIFPEEDSFRTALQRNHFYFHDPEPDEITPVQRAWLKDYVNRFEAALYGPNFADAQKGYRAFIDVPTFIDYHLFSEVTKNVDAFRFSTFYYKDRGALLKMGPVWDWNLSFGNADGKQGYMPHHWLWPQLDDQQYSWFRRLFEDPDFGQRYVDRWQELRASVFATTNVLGRIDALAKFLHESQQRNFRRWEILGREISPNYFVGDSYQEEIDWMKNWTSNRLAWIEAQFPSPPVVKLGDKLALTTTNSGAKIFYTTDGTDPRAPGGQPAAHAREFSGPIALPATIVARTLVEAHWSGPVRYPKTP